MTYCISLHPAAFRIFQSGRQDVIPANRYIWATRGREGLRCRVASEPNRDHIARACRGRDNTVEGSLVVTMAVEGADESSSVLVAEGDGDILCWHVEDVGHERASEMAGR